MDRISTCLRSSTNFMFICNKLLRSCCLRAPSRNGWRSRGHQIPPIILQERQKSKDYRLPKCLHGNNFWPFGFKVAISQPQFGSAMETQTIVKRLSNSFDKLMDFFNLIKNFAIKRLDFRFGFGDFLLWLSKFRVGRLGRSTSKIGPHNIFNKSLDLGFGL